VAVDPRQGRTGGSGKVRTLTDEELSLSRVAEENVKRALEQQLKNQLDGIDANGVEYSVIVIIISNEIVNDLFFHILKPRAPASNLSKSSKGEDDLLIDQMLGVTKAPPNPLQKQAQKQQLIQQSMQTQQPKQQQQQQQQQQQPKRQQQQQQPTPT